MSRDFWTIYDDDSMEFEQELIQEEQLPNMRLDSVMQHVLKMMQEDKTQNVDHFESESELFEV